MIFYLEKIYQIPILEKIWIFSLKVFRATCMAHTVLRSRDSSITKLDTSQLRFEHPESEFVKLVALESPQNDANSFS